MDNLSNVNFRKSHIYTVIKNRWFGTFTPGDFNCFVTKEGPLTQNMLPGRYMTKSSAVFPLFFFLLTPLLLYKHN